MEKTLIALVLAGLMGGLAGGYGLNYVIYRPQIQNLQNDIEALNSSFETLDADLTNLDNIVESSVTSLDDDVGDLGSDVISLEDEFTSLDSRVDTLENRTWHEIYTVTASSDLVSGMFRLKGKEVKISWFAVSDYADAWVAIELYFSNGTLYSIWGSSGVYATMDNEIHLSQAGDYYLAVTTYLTEYAVRLYDYY